MNKYIVGLNGSSVNAVDYKLINWRYKAGEILALDWVVRRVINSCRFIPLILTLKVGGQ